MAFHLKFLSATLSICLLSLSSSIISPVAIASEGQSQSDVALVRRKAEPEAVSPLARLEGKMQIRQGCVYIITKERKVPLLAIWPSTYRLAPSEGVPKGVTDTATGHTLKFGVNSVFASGETKTAPTQSLDAPIPTTCDGKLTYAEFP